MRVGSEVLVRTPGPAHRTLVPVGLKDAFGPLGGVKDAFAPLSVNVRNIRGLTRLASSTFAQVGCD